MSCGYPVADTILKTQLNTFIALEEGLYANNFSGTRYFFLTKGLSIVNIILISINYQ